MKKYPVLGIFQFDEKNLAEILKLIFNQLNPFFGKK
jgi:hypothetical protein